MVVRAIAVRDWHQAGRRGVSPTRELRRYRTQIHRRRLGKYVGALKRLHYQLPVGAIVIVPGPGYFSDVLIGEVTGRTADLRIEAYPDENLQARRVRWIGRQQKAAFSPEMIDSLKTRNPLTVLGRSLRDEVLRVAYDQYVLGDTFTTRFETTNADFSILDDYDIQTFLTFVAGLLAAYEQGYPEDQKIGLSEAISILRANRGSIPELGSNINSPGFLRLFSGKNTPLVIAVLLSLALSGEANADPDSIHVTNSKAPAGDPCALSVEPQVRGVVRLMKLDDWQRTCIQARDAHKETGLKTSVTVKIEKEDKHR